jgi:hypothetical protein
MLARALQESLNTESPPNHISQLYQPFPYLIPMEMFRYIFSCKLIIVYVQDY